MTNFLLVANDDSDLGVLSAELEKDTQNVVHHSSSGEDALGLLGNEKIQVVVAGEELRDSDGLTFVKKLTHKHPLINCAMISSLPPEKFHEETEGLGVFMQLPQIPGLKEVEQMMGLLESISALLQKA